MIGAIERSMLQHGISAHIPHGSAQANVHTVPGILRLCYSFNRLATKYELVTLPSLLALAVFCLVCMHDGTRLQ